MGKKISYICRGGVRVTVNPKDDNPDTKPAQAITRGMNQTITRGRNNVE